MYCFTTIPLFNSDTLHYRRDSTFWHLCYGNWSSHPIGYHLILLWRHNRCIMKVQRSLPPDLSCCVVTYKSLLIGRHANLLWRHNRVLWKYNVHYPRLWVTVLRLTSVYWLVDIAIFCDVTKTSIFLSPYSYLSTIMVFLEANPSRSHMRTLTSQLHTQLATLTWIWDVIVIATPSLNFINLS